MNKISVIVPCYNVAPYLQRCVDSILNQTYSNFELILVDDGSTDETGTLCDKLLQADERIKVVHKHNGGLSDARNAGIDVAAGDFLSFVDGDDYLELNAYELMVTEMQDADVSLVSAGIIIEDIKGNKSTLMNDSRVLLSKEEAFINLLGNNRTIGQSSCNKLFRHELFNQLRYKKGVINEDTQLLPFLLDISNKILLLNKPVYHYIKRNGSLTQSAFSMWKYNGIKHADETMNLCKKKYPSLVSYANYYKLDTLNKMYEELLASENRKEYHKEEWILRCKIVFRYVICLRYANIKKESGQRMKNMALTAFLSRELTDKLVNCKNTIIKGKKSNE